MSLNSQVVLVSQALKSKRTFVIVTSLIPIGLFLKAGFISISVIWFFALCLYNCDSSLRKRFKAGHILLFPILLFALFLLWIFVSDDFRAAFELALRKIHLLLIPLGFIIVDKKISDKDLRIILAVFLGACIICSFICVTHAIYSILRFQSLIYRVGDTDFHYYSNYLLAEPVNIEPIYLSLYCCFAFLIAIKTPFTTKPSFKAAIAIYLALFILLISSKVGIVCLILIVLIWFITPYGKASFFILLVALIIAAMISYYNYSLVKEKNFASLLFYYKDNNGDVKNIPVDQFIIWQSALETIRQNPTVGYGTAGGQKALEETYQKKGFVAGIRDSLNPHNEFFSTALDLGIIGLLTLITMLVAALIQAFKTKDILRIGFIFIIIFFFCSESMLVRQKGIVFFSFFYSIIFCVDRSTTMDVKQASRSD